jgi:uncharacterized protein YndB with AHSA1/START domain
MPTQRDADMPTQRDAEQSPPSIRISATPEEVFPYLTDPELLALWLADWADTNPEPGGRFAINVGDSKVRGTYVLISPPHRVAFTWGLHENTVLPEGSSTVEIYLTVDGEETIVDLTHRAPFGVASIMSP